MHRYIKSPSYYNCASHFKNSCRAVLMLRSATSLNVLFSYITIRQKMGINYPNLEHFYFTNMNIIGLFVVAFNSNLPFAVALFFF